MPKIHSLRKNEVEIESETSSFQAERSQLPEPELNSISVEPAFFCRPPMVKRFFSPALQSWLPVSLHSNLVNEVKGPDSPEDPDQAQD